MIDKAEPTYRYIGEKIYRGKRKPKKKEKLYSRKFLEIKRNFLIEC